MDFETYLKQELYTIAVQELGLDNKIEVVNFRSFKMPEDKSTFLFVIKYLTGNYIGGIKTQPVQIFVYSELNEISNAYLILDYFSKKYNNYQDIINSEFIKINFDTPVSMRNFIQSEEGYRASVYVFGTIITCENVLDIKSISLNNEDLTVNDETLKFGEIEYLSASFGYTAVLNTTKIKGVQLSTSIKQEAGLTLNLTMMNKENDFCKLINYIMFGDVTGNYEFNFMFTKNNGTTQSVSMKLESISLPTNKTAAPSLTLNFRK